MWIGGPDVVQGQLPRHPVNIPAAPHHPSLPQAGEVWYHGWSLRRHRLCSRPQQEAEASLLVRERPEGRWGAGAVWGPEEPRLCPGGAAVSRCRGGEPAGDGRGPPSHHGPAKRACPAGEPGVELMNSRDARRALSIQLGALVIKDGWCFCRYTGCLVGGIHLITCRCGASHVLGYHWTPPHPQCPHLFLAWSFYKPHWFFVGGNRKGCLFTQGGHRRNLVLISKEYLKVGEGSKHAQVYGSE